MLYPEASIFSGGWLRLRIRLKVDKFQVPGERRVGDFFNLLWFPRSQGSEKIQIYQTGKFKSREAKWFAWGHLPKMLLSEQKCMSIHTSSTHSFSKETVSVGFIQISLLFENDVRFFLANSLGFWHKQWNHPLVFAVVRQTPMQPLKNQFPALHWEHELGLAFTKNRMNYTNKFLVIPESETTLFTRRWPSEGPYLKCE